MTFKILIDDANKIVCRSNVRPIDDSSSANLKDYLLTTHSAVKSIRDSDNPSVSDEPSLLDENDEILCD